MTATIAQQPNEARSLSLRERFTEIRSTSMRITEGLSPEDQMLQSMPEASPTKWHLAHTTWFFETFVLQSYLPNYKPFDPRYTYLFNSYYKQLGAHPYRGSRGLMSRPSLQQVHAYRNYVERVLLGFLEKAGDDGLELVELGLNHEQQHQELILTDIKHAIWSSPLRPEPVPGPDARVSTPRMNWTEIEGGIHAVGHQGSGFAFDNESPRHEVLLQPFRIASRPVTNAEYLEFMQDDGYRRPELWLSDGWDTVCEQHWDAPLYWEHHDDGSWWQFTMNGVKEVDPAEPVCHVSFYEADAYARWCGARLPTEEEWEVAAVRMPSRGTFLEDYIFHPQPARGEGNLQMFGDVWEWTASPYIAYPGFQPAAGLIGEYNGKFMCNQMVLRGGSCATPASHIRASYRNFFPPPARWQFSGIRLSR
ncbi:MAG TPA: ergothioneine biosynthesis protein EgtB [Terriglobales bacterium]|nr:ergothioneine biosynthesis protein EgtB [Terriglobales bacterium]